VLKNRYALAWLLNCWKHSMKGMQKLKLCGNHDISSQTNHPITSPCPSKFEKCWCGCSNVLNFHFIYSIWHLNVKQFHADQNFTKYRIYLKYSCACVWAGFYHKIYRFPNLSYFTTISVNPLCLNAVGLKEWLYCSGVFLKMED